MLGMVSKMRRTGCIKIEGHNVKITRTGSTIIAINEAAFHVTPCTMRYTFTFADGSRIKMSKMRFEAYANMVKGENILTDGFDGFRS